MKEYVMAAAKKKQKEAMKPIISKYYSRGYPLDSIVLMLAAEGFSTTKATIKKYIQELLKDWRKEGAGNLSTLIELEVQKIDVLIAELWQQWDKSTQDYALKETRDSGDSSVEINKEYRGLGDVNYLREIKDLYEKRQTLVGTEDTKEKPLDDETIKMMYNILGDAIK